MTGTMESKEITIEAPNGKAGTYTLYKLPYMAARKIAAYYPVSNLPKLGDYDKSEEGARLLFSHIGVTMPSGEVLKLSTSELINNHVPDPVIGIKLEAAALAYNFDFFGQGGLSAFLRALVKDQLPLVIQTLMESLPPSLVQALQDGVKSNTD